MKNLIFVFVIIGTIISCSFNKEIDPENSKGKFDPDQFPQKWQLIIKFRKLEDNVVTKGTGNYALVILSDGKYLELIYESNDDIIGNCTGEAKELLYLNSENKLIGTWNACDGPGLVYERVE